MMKNFKKGLVMAAIVFLAAGAFTAPKAHAAGSANGKSPADYTATSYHVDMDVKSNNAMLVTETITVDFYAPHHGIFRYIPLEGQAYYKVNNKAFETNRKMRIDQVKVAGGPFTTRLESGNFVIQIGDANKRLSGKHT